MSSPRRDPQITVGRAAFRLLLSQLVLRGGLFGGALLIGALARRIPHQNAADVAGELLLVALVLGVLLARRKILVLEEPFSFDSSSLGRFGDSWP